MNIVTMFVPRIREIIKLINNQLNRLMSLTDWSLALSGFGSKGNAFVSLSLLGLQQLKQFAMSKFASVIAGSQ